MNVENEADVGQYWRDRAWLQQAVHELPAGVLYGAKGATSAECSDLMTGLDDSAAVCARLALGDHELFIEDCRWHFEHYAHYLGRRSHFNGYESYVATVTVRGLSQRRPLHPAGLPATPITPALPADVRCARPS